MERIDGAGSTGLEAPSRGGAARAIPAAAAALVAGTGCLVLIGWWQSIRRLEGLLPGWPTMKPITAFGLLLAAISLGLLRQREAPRSVVAAGRFAALLVLLIALATLVEFATGRELGLDNLLIGHPTGAAANVFAGRMSMTTAIALALVGGSLLLLDSATRAIHPAQVLAPIAALIGFLAVLGYLYDVQSLLRVDIFSSMALHTALAILVLCVGILAARPDRGWVTVIASPGAGGIVARRLLPAVLLAPPLIGWVRLLGQDAGWYNTEFGLAIFASSNVVVFALLTIGLAREIQRLDLRRKQAATQRFHELLESVPDAMLMVGDSGHIVHANAHAYALFGYAPGELRDALVEHLLPDRYRRQHSSHRAAYQAQPRSRMMGAGLELSALRKNASEFPVEISLSPVAGEDSGSILCAIRDVSVRNRQETLLREKNAALANADRAKDRFLASMSHELRTPLNAIIGFAQLLENDQVGRDTPQHKEFMGYILTSGRHLLQLVNDVLDLSKIEAGKLAFHPEAVDLPVLLDEVLGIVRTMAASKGTRIEAAVDPRLTDVLIDAARFKQVLYNYVSNAIKFTPEGGRIAIHILEEPEAPLFFRLEVRDTGAGIDPRDVQRLFLEFHQLKSNAAEAQPGTGLGLALTKRLVETQGGFVGVHSDPGRGSTFYAVLPRHAQAVLTGDLPAYAAPENA